MNVLAHKMAADHLSLHPYCFVGDAHQRHGTGCARIDECPVQEGDAHGAQVSGPDQVIGARPPRLMHLHDQPAVVLVGDTPLAAPLCGRFSRARLCQLLEQFGLLARRKPQTIDILAGCVIVSTHVCTVFGKICYVPCFSLHRLP